MALFYAFFLQGEEGTICIKVLCNVFGYQLLLQSPLKFPRKCDVQCRLDCVESGFTCVFTRLPQSAFYAQCQPMTFSAALDNKIRNSCWICVQLLVDLMFFFIYLYILCLVYSPLVLELISRSNAQAYLKRTEPRVAMNARVMVDLKERNEFRPNIAVSIRKCTFGDRDDVIIISQTIMQLQFDCV